MDSAPPAPSVLDTLRTVEFRLGLKGYNVDEVDEYLEKAAVEAEAMKEQLRQAGDRLAQATQRIGQLERDDRSGAAPAPVPAPAPIAESAPVADDTLQRTLMLAQRFVDQTKRESENEAAQMVSRAEEQARAIVHQAEERARQLSADAEHRLREEVARLESTRSQLAGDVESLARHLESERGRLRTSLSEMLKWLDEKVQPTASLMALRQRTGDGSRPAGGEGSANGDRGEPAGGGTAAGGRGGMMDFPRGPGDPPGQGGSLLP